MKYLLGLQHLPNNKRKINDDYECSLNRKKGNRFISVNGDNPIKLTNGDNEVHNNKAIGEVFKKPSERKNCYSRNIILEKVSV